MHHVVDVFSCAIEKKPELYEGAANDSIVCHSLCSGRSINQKHFALNPGLDTCIKISSAPFSVIGEIRNGNQGYGGFSFVEVPPGKNHSFGGRNADERAIFGQYFTINYERKGARELGDVGVSRHVAIAQRDERGGNEDHSGVILRPHKSYYVV